MGTSTRRMDPASAPPGGRDFDMSRGPGKKQGLNPKDLVPGGTSFEENAIVKEVVSEFLNKGKVWDVQKETWVTKQTPPMTTSATKPANMGVGQQQPVVTGAGSMKNIDKAKMNKEPAPAAKRKTAPRPRKNIEAAIMKAATLALEKARGKQGRAIPKSRQFKQSDLGRGATTFTETTEKRSKGGRAIPKSRQFKQGDKKSRLGRRGGMSGKQQAPVKRATGGMAETYRG